MERKTSQKHENKQKACRNVFFFFWFSFVFAKYSNQIIKKKEAKNKEKKGVLTQRQNVNKICKLHKK